MSLRRREFLGGAASLAAGRGDAAGLKPVRVGIVGAGTRGTSLLRTLLELPSVEIRAVADIDDNAIAQAQKLCADAGREKPVAYPRGPEDFRRLVEHKDLDVVITATPWEWHARVMLAAMDAGRYAVTEVPAAVTIDECWALVEKAEKTRVPCTMLENWIYRREPMAVLNMARAGLLGEIVYCESGYGHDVRYGNFSRGAGTLAWRGGHAARRNGDLYPTHPFAPVAMLMDINYGARIEHVMAMSTVSRGMNRYAADLWGAGHPLAKRSYAGGDRTNAMVQLNDGRAALNFHDTQSWHPRDDGHKYMGTKGTVRWPFPEKGTIWLLDRHWDRKAPYAAKWQPLDPLLEEFDHPLWKRYGKHASTRNHDGSDYLELVALLESIREGTPPPVSIVDAVTWSAIAPLSEQSIAGGGVKVAMPDFTRGKWKTNGKFMIRGRA
jgi:predicted dehydrogenase